MHNLRAYRFQGYTGEHFRKDLLSGIIVGVIAVPLGMAFAIASGVDPQYGMYTTIVAGILISLLGGSKFQIGGPTGAFIPILLGIVTVYGYQNLLIAGFMAGIILLLMGLLGLGSLIKFIPRPVTIGFTTGIAVLIFSGQLANFFGLTEIEQHERFLDNMIELFRHIADINFLSVLTAVISFVVMLLTPRIWSKVPGSLVGLIVASLLAYFLYPEQVATIGSTYGEITNKLPALQFPEITWERIGQLLVPALLIAMLGGIESLLSAVVADGMTSTRHNSNRELIGQGIANMVTPLFGGIPATGAIARTATNIKNGATSPVSGIIHGIVVLFILLLFAPYATHIPLAAMAPILMVVAWNMSERKRFTYILRLKSGDSLVLVVTFLLTVFTNLTIGVTSGLILSFVLFTKQMSEMMVAARALPNHEHKHEKVQTQVFSSTRDCPQLTIYNVEGILFFGAAQSFEEDVLDTLHDKPRVLLLRLSRVPYIDVTGTAYVSNVVNYVQRYGGTVLISGMSDQLQEMFIKSYLYQQIGEKHIFKRTGEAINYALTLLDYKQCQACQQFAFRECQELSETTQTMVERIPLMERNYYES